MKKILLILVALLHSCAGGLAPLPAAEPEVRRAIPVDAPYVLTLSEADVRATVAHMQRLAKDQQGQLDTAKKELSAEHELHLQVDLEVRTAAREAKADHAAQARRLLKTGCLVFR